MYVMNAIIAYNNWNTMINYLDCFVLNLITAYGSARYKIAAKMANSADLDQTAHNEQSELVLHCLPRNIICVQIFW